MKFTLIPILLFGFKLCCVSRCLKNTSQEKLDTANLRSDLLKEMANKYKKELLFSFCLIKFLTIEDF